MEGVTEEEKTSGKRGCCGYMTRCWDYFRENTYVISCLGAVVLGIVLGLFLKLYIELSEQVELYIDFPGELLMRMLEMIFIPLIVTSVITSFSGLKEGIPEKIALRATVYCVSTTILSITLGLILVLFIKPGVGTVIIGKKDKDLFFFADALIDLVWSIAPENFNLACYRQHKIVIVELENTSDEQQFHLEENETQVGLMDRDIKGINVLGLIFWSFILGLVLNRIAQCTGLFLEAVTVVNETTKHAVDLIMCYVPIALVFMVTSLILEVDSWEILFKLGKYIGVVMLGLVIHGILVLPLIYVLCVRRNPYAVIKGFFPALMIAFISSSSSATLPVTFKCCNERLQINKIISRYMLPIETNINRDGTVLYEVVSTVFIIQLNNIRLDLNQWIALAVTSAVSSVRAAGIPARGAVTTCFVLTAFGLPAKEICILVFVECLLDHCNTVVNVMGDCFGVALIDQVYKRDLEDTLQNRKWNEGNKARSKEEQHKSDS